MRERPNTPVEILIKNIVLDRVKSRLKDIFPNNYFQNNILLNQTLGENIDGFMENLFDIAKKNNNSLAFVNLGHIEKYDPSIYQSSYSNLRFKTYRGLLFDVDASIGSVLIIKPVEGLHFRLNQHPSEDDIHFLSMIFNEGLAKKTGKREYDNKEEENKANKKTFFDKDEYATITTMQLNKKPNKKIRKTSIRKPKGTPKTLAKKSNANSGKKMENSKVSNEIVQKYLEEYEMKRKLVKYLLSKKEEKYSKLSLEQLIKVVDKKKK